MTTRVATLWDPSVLSTTRFTADFAMSAGIGDVFPIVHTPYKHYEVLSFT